MAEGHKSVVSYCGGFIAILKNGGNLLEIIEVPTGKTHRSYDLVQMIREHSRRNDIEIKVDNRTINNTQLSWEQVVESSRTTKIGLVLDDFSMLMIIDIREVQSVPVVIYEDSKEGIERFEWIPPVAIADEQKYGGYVNSRQVAVFTKDCLHMKLFSLDCTAMLLSICKPVTSKIIVRPEHYHHNWSIVAHSLDYSSSPIIYHFLNNGSTSSILYYFKLPVFSQSSFDISWSGSGKWLLYFNDADSLFGFNLKVFNSLGLYKKKSQKQEEIPLGDPLMDVEYNMNGIDYTTQNGGRLETGSSVYLFQWLVYDSKDYSFITTAAGDSTLEFLIFSINDCRLVEKTLVNLSDVVVVWKDHYENNSYKFRKVTNKGIGRESFIPNKILSKDGIICVVSESRILIYKAEFEPKVHFEDYGMFDLNCNLLFIQFMESNPNFLLIGTEHGVILYDIYKQVIFNAYTARQLRSDSVHLSGNTLAIHTPNLRSSKYTWEFHDLNRLMTSSEDSNYWIMENFQYKDDNPKMLSLIKDVHHSELSRIKRNRFDQRRLSILNTNSEEITDTFNLQKRQRK